MEDSLTISVHLFFHITFYRDNKLYFYDVIRMPITASSISNISFSKLFYVTTYNSYGNGGNMIATECNDRNITFILKFFEEQLTCNNEVHCKFRCITFYICLNYLFYAFTTYRSYVNSYPIYLYFWLLYDGSYTIWFVYGSYTI